MAKKRTTLEKMKANPRDGWLIRDIKKLCKEHGLHCEAPTRGDHYKVYSDVLEGTLTVPAHRPVKPYYIKSLTSYIDAHLVRIERGEK